MAGGLLMLGSYLRLFRGHWPMLLFGLLSVFWGNFGQSFFISWYGAPIQAEFGLSASAYGALYSLATLASGCSLLLFGGAIDRMPLERFLKLAAAGLCLAALLLWWSPVVPVVAVALFLLRFCGQGLLPHTGMTTMARYFDINRGKAVSIASNGVPLGEVLLPMLAVLAIGALGWRSSWLLVALGVPLVYLPLAHWLLRRAGRLDAAGDARSGAVPAGSLYADGSRRTLMRDRRFWCALPLLMMPPFLVTGIFIQQPYVLAQKGWSPEWFATSFVLYGVAHWSMTFVAGSLIDRFSALRLMRLIAVPFALGLAIAAAMPGAWAAMAMMACLGAGMGLAGPIGGAIWAEICGTRHLGSIRAMIAAIMVLATSAAPVVFGLGIDAGWNALELFAVLGLVLLGALALSLGSWPGRDYRGVVHEDR